MISVVVYPFESVFQILIFGEILEVNGWHTHIKVKKKIRSIVINAQVGKFV